MSQEERNDVLRWCFGNGLGMEWLSSQVFGDGEELSVEWRDSQSHSCDGTCLLGASSSTVLFMLFVRWTLCRPRPERHLATMCSAFLSEVVPCLGEPTLWTRSKQLGKPTARTSWRTALTRAHWDRVLVAGASICVSLSLDVGTTAHCMFFRSAFWADGGDEAVLF